jgi:predicted TPR repeat methyltransferase
MNSHDCYSSKIQFDEEYFENGLQSKKSAYENYRWMPERSLREAMSIIQSIEFDSVLDFGCAKGFLVKALNLLGKNAEGIDISDYAIENCDPAVKSFVSTKPISDIKDGTYDLLVTKDVLEHIPKSDLPDLMLEFRRVAKSIFLIVPLGEQNRYRIREYELDSTHVVRENEDYWLSLVLNAGFKVTFFDYRCGYLKEKWVEEHEFGNLFLVAR